MVEVVVGMDTMAPMVLVLVHLMHLVLVMVVAMVAVAMVVVTVGGNGTALDRMITQSQVPWDNLILKVTSFEAETLTSIEVGILHSIEVATTVIPSDAEQRVTLFEAGCRWATARGPGPPCLHILNVTVKVGKMVFLSFSLLITCHVTMSRMPRCGDIGTPSLDILPQ